METNLAGLAGRWFAKRSVVTFTVAGNQQGCPADPRRWAVHFFASTSGITCDPFPPVSGLVSGGYAVPSAHPPLKFNYRDDGIIVQWEWRLIGVGAMSTVQVFEIFWR